MYFQIREVILWPRADHPPRRVIFQPGKLNVISGASKTGKSALIPVIDYCLGSGRCAIPTGVIRNACSWFGIIVDTAEGQKLIAREEPRDQRQTENMFLLEGETVEVPVRISQRNSNAGQVRAMLNRLSGTTNLPFETEPTAGYSARPSIRDFMAFIFQPQNVVANPDILFYKADTNEHREKLKIIFPYVLGAVTSQTLLDRWELDIAAKALRRKERELLNTRAVSQRWQSEARSWLDRARELGLYSAGRSIPAQWPELVDTLRKLATTTFTDSKPAAAAIDEALAETFRLVDQERTLSAELFELRTRLAELKGLKEGASAFGSALQIQKERLSLSSWLKGLAATDKAESAITPALRPSAELDQLCMALARIEQEALRQPSSSETIDRELVRLKDAIHNKTEQLEALRTRLKGRRGLEKASPEGYSIPEIERYLGRLEQALATYDTLGSDSELAFEIEQLRAQMAELGRRVGEPSIHARLERALAQVHSIAATILPKLDAEFPDYPIELSIKDLSIKILRPEREDWLWEIGSGANYLAYHIAVTAALQRFFMKTEGHPVPHLLIYDQPSQVYFPRSLAGDQPEPEWTDEEVEAVTKVFAALSDEVARSQGNLQVIILDHAAQDVWGTIGNIHLVGEWRGGEKLVPEAWL
jgi:hypothetical protein